MKISILFLSVSLFLGTTAGQQLEKMFSVSGLPYIKNAKMFQISSYDKSGRNSDFITLAPLENKVIAEAGGPGVINRIWITISARDKYFLRKMILRMYWDGEENPSVEVPVGDFFGTGFEYKQHLPLLIGMSSGGYYSYFPMPFNVSAKITIENQSDEEVPSFYFHISYYKLNSPFDDDVAYFHSSWNRDSKTGSGQNYVLLDAAGTGHFVGCNMSMQSYNKQLWFLEGDEMVYTDGEEFPSIYGTGTEDYFTGGWYFRDGEFSHPYHGLIIKDEQNGRIAAYRFHIGDAIPFQKSLRFTIETGHNNEEKADYSSTAYWYQKEPHKKFADLPKAGLRIPLRVITPDGLYDAEKAEYSGKAERRVADMTDYGCEWSSGKQLEILCSSDKNKFEISFDGLRESEYQASLYFTKGPDYGMTEIYFDGKKIGEYDGYSGQIIPGGKVDLGILRKKDNRLKIEFRIAGKNSGSGGYKVGLDGVYFDPVRKFINEWWIIGPFTNQKNPEGERTGLGTPFPPENEIVYSKKYEGDGGQAVSWRSVKAETDGLVQLYDKFRPKDLVVAYAVTFIHSDEEKEYPFLFGSDDGIKIFLNGEEKFRFLDIRIAKIDENEISLNLKKGWNTLLLKIENNLGGYGFYGRVIDPENKLKISPLKM